MYNYNNMMMPPWYSYPRPTIDDIRNLEQQLMTWKKEYKDFGNEPPKGQIKWSKKTWGWILFWAFPWVALCYSYVLISAVVHLMDLVNKLPK